MFESTLVGVMISERFHSIHYIRFPQMCEKVGYGLTLYSIFLSMLLKQERSHPFDLSVFLFKDGVCANIRLVSMYMLKD